jgi:hypothetical protein
MSDLFYKKKGKNSLADLIRFGPDPAGFFPDPVQKTGSESI